MPADFVLKAANDVHRALMALSGGRIGWTTAGMPVLELTTVGRKSGQPRSSMLTSPWQQGDTMAIVASRGGDDKHPAWFLNLRDQPSVEVKTKDGTKAMTARILSSEERAPIWAEISSEYKNYADYQAKTDREIPVILLEPTS